MPIFAQFADQPGHALQRRGKRLDRADLRPDVNAHSRRIQPMRPRRPPIDRPRQPNLHSKLVTPQPGRDIRMRLRKDIRIHPQRKPRPYTQRLRPLGQQLQLRLRLHVEQQNPCLQRRVDLPLLLARAGKNHALQRCFIRSPNPLQLAAAHNVKPRAQLRQQPQNRQRRVRLHRIADRRLTPRERLLKQPKPMANLSRRVDVQRRPMRLRQLRQRDPIATQSSPAIMERPRRDRQRRSAFARGPPRASAQTPLPVPLSGSTYGASGITIHAMMYASTPVPANRTHSTHSSRTVTMSHP